MELAIVGYLTIFLFKVHYNLLYLLSGGSKLLFDE